MTFELTTKSARTHHQLNSNHLSCANMIVSLAARGLWGVAQGAYIITVLPIGVAKKGGGQEEKDDLLRQTTYANDTKTSHSLH